MVIKQPYYIRKKELNTNLIFFWNWKYQYWSEFPDEYCQFANEQAATVQAANHCKNNNPQIQVECVSFMAL